MPPARKDSFEADDPSRPSTSRAFSPALPPVKKARTSTGGVPSAPSRRQSMGGGGGRQSRLDEFIDEKPPSPSDPPSPPSIESLHPTISPPPILPSRARINWRRLGERILSAKTPPIPSFTLGLFEIRKKEGAVYEIKRGPFKVESDGTELCKSVEDRVRDPPSTVTQWEEKRRDETGRVRVWPGGEAMAYWIMEGVIRVEGRRVMEIGCGAIALPSRVAVWKGAREVKANDGSDECIESVRRSTKDEKKIEVEKMEWGKREVKEDEKMELILAADAVFFERSHDALMDTIDSWMEEGGETWIAAPERRGSLERWKRRVEEDGRWRMEEWKEAEERLREEVKKEIDEDEDMPRLDLQDRLLLTVMETADEIMKEEEEEGKEKIEIDPEVISAAAGIVWDALAEDWATDLAAFSKHAGRETIREEDVRLLMRRNPDMMAEIFGEMEAEEGTTTVGTIKRRSTGGLVSGRPRKEPREEEETTIFDDVTTPQGASSMTSVVPETPQGIVPLAHSTPMNNRIVSRIMGADPTFSIPSPIREEDEMDGSRREGRRTNRSILNDLSATMREGDGMNGGGDGGMMGMDNDHDLSPIVLDLRHPREQEDEERRMSRREEREKEEQPGPSRQRKENTRGESPELWSEGEEKKEEEHDSFDDDVAYENKENEGGVRRGDESHRMSESAALREMLDEDEEEKEKTVIGREREDSFDDNSIQFVEEKKKEEKVTDRQPIGSFPSTSADSPTVQQPSTTAAAAIPAARAESTTSLRSSQDSFYNDEILEVIPPKAVVVPPAAPAPTLQQQPAAVVAAQPVRPSDYDSFDDDDDDFVAAPTRSKETTPKAIGGPSPSNTVANRWSMVEVEEVVSQKEAQKNGGARLGVFAEDIFGFNNIAGPSKKTPVNKPSPNVPSRPSPAATVPLKPSPTVPKGVSPTVHAKPSANPFSMNGKETPVNKNGKEANARFSFFDDAPTNKTPTLQREDSDFLDTSTRQTTSTMRTPIGRGGRGRGFPRKPDPNSRVNRMIREQTMPVKLSPRPPSRISEVVGSFEDDDFDVSAFDD